MTFCLLGALSLLCDVNEYSKCIKNFNIPLVNRIFDTLKSLCNLLIVLPKELKRIFNEEDLVGVLN